MIVLATVTGVPSVVEPLKAPFPAALFSPTLIPCASAVVGAAPMIPVIPAPVVGVLLNRAAMYHLDVLPGGTMGGRMVPARPSIVLIIEPATAPSEV